MRNIPLSDEQICEAARLYDLGLSCAKIGKILGVNAGTVRNRLIERGVVMRGVHGRDDVSAMYKE